MNTFYTLASSSYPTVVGFSVQQMLQWATSSVLRLFVGTPLSVLNYLKGWIIAALIIAAIIYFALAALEFFRH